MAATKISNVIVPDVFNPYVTERTTELANFYMGGILSNDSNLDALAMAGGKLINMPFWQDLSGADEILSDSGSLTPAAITSGQDIAALHMRGKAWGVNDLAKALSGDDPMGVIGNLVADYWARRLQDVAIASLEGVIADNDANDSDDMINSIAAESTGAQTASTKFSGDALQDTVATFGDAFGGLAGLGMHSVVYHYLKKLDPTSFERESQGPLEIETYKGLRLIVNDAITSRAGTTSGTVYTTYLFGNGALGFGNGEAPVPSETDRDSLAGEDYLITRRHFLIHPRGVKFTSSSVAGATPTNAELALAANWDRVYDRKNIRIAALVTN